MKRHVIIWISMFAAVVVAWLFALARMFEPAIICGLWILFVLVCNIIALERDERRIAKRKGRVG